MRPIPSPILAIADGDVLGPKLLDSAGAAVRGGILWLCLRMKGETDERCREAVRALRQRCPDAVISLNGSLDAAEVAGAAIHLPSRGGSVAAARERFPERVLGVSCHERAEIESALAQGADYVLLSPLFAPTSKAPGGRVLGVEGFRRECRGLRLPVLALGGITAERMEAAAKAGAKGIAVLGSLFQAPDVEQRARELRAAAREVFGE